MTFWTVLIAGSGFYPGRLFSAQALKSDFLLSNKERQATPPPPPPTPTSPPTPAQPHQVTDHPWVWPRCLRTWNLEQLSRFRHQFLSHLEKTCQSVVGTAKSPFSSQLSPGHHPRYCQGQALPGTEVQGQLFEKAEMWGG